VPIMIFQSCDNLAGYSFLSCGTPLQEEEQYTRFKIISLTKSYTHYSSLVVIDSKEIEFHNRLSELLQHFTTYKMKVIISYLYFDYIILILYYFILA